ncbi:hypothetical protein JW960_27105 [candidate division KSB1 bacterium]|nr:hypothetical protein [candidate division KSB1 bacterium]
MGKSRAHSLNAGITKEIAQQLEPFKLKWLKEPLNRGNFEGLAQLRKNTTTPIAGGELNSSWRNFKAMLEIGSLDVYQPDAVMAGGTYAGGISVVYWLIREIQKRNAAIETDSPNLDKPELKKLDRITG